MHENDTDLLSCFYTKNGHKSLGELCVYVLPRLGRLPPSLSHRQTDLSSVHAHDRQHSIAQQKADEVVSDLAEHEIVLRGAGKRQAEGDGQKDTGEEIHRRLVGNQRVDAAAEIASCVNKHHKHHRVSTDASHACNESDHY